MVSRLHHTTALALTALAVCAGLACDADEGERPLADDAFLGAGKADGAFGVEEGSAEANAVLKLVNEASFAVLDDDVGLDRRAVESLVDARELAPLTTLAQLDAVKFIGKAAFGLLIDYVRDEGLVIDDASTLRIATFNLRWFGLDGDLTGSLGTESRVATVRAFIEEHLADRDVIVFEEIVDKQLFFDEVVPHLTCESYDTTKSKHQHVVVCHTDAFSLQPSEGDDNFALEAVNIGGTLRPAVYGTLHDADGEPVAQLIGVHLKANEQSTAKRMAQAEVLQERVAELRAQSDLPVIMTGDFNTHFAIHTGRTDDDEVILEDILAPLQRVKLPVTFTYQEPSVKQRRLDHAFVSPGVKVDRVASPGACDLDPVSGLAQVQKYYDTLSDHCPVIVDLTLP